jgi:RNA polymerase sigma factor (sigma-70 family)
MTSDAALLAAAGTDPGAFRELYDRYAERVLGYHVRRCRDEDAAHELVAETFAQAWLVRARFRDECDGSAGPWLFGIARNVLLASVRRRALEAGARERLGMLAAPAAAEPDESWLEGLDEALAALPAAQRDAIRLRVVDELAYADVAAALRTTPAAARVRVHRGLAALRHRFRPPSGDVTKESPR